MKGIAVSGFVADRERLVSQPDKTTRAKKEVIDRRTNSKCDCLRFATMVMMNFSARCGANSIADLQERFGGTHSADGFTIEASSTRKTQLATGWPWPFSTITQCAFAALGGATPCTSNFVH